MKPLRLFISCAPQDLSFAAHLQSQLNAAGQQSWFKDTEQGNFAPGIDLTDAIRQTIEQSDALLLLLSPHSLASSAVRMEWQYAHLQNIPVLLLVVQSVTSTELLAALDPCLPSHNSPPDGQLLLWIDVRGQPLKAAWNVLAWLKDRSVSHHDLPPAPVELTRFYEEIIPSSARLAGWSQIALALLGIPIALGGLWDLVRTQLQPAPTLFLDQFLLTLLTFVFLIWLVRTVQLGWNGFQTFRRRCKNPGKMLFQLNRLFSIVALFLFLMGIASILLGKTALLNGFLYPTRAILYGGISSALSIGYSVIGVLFKRSRELRAWLPEQPPAYAISTLQDSATTSPDIHILPSAPSSIPANGKERGAPAKRANGAAVPQGQTSSIENTAAEAAVSRLYLTRRLRLAVSGDPEKPELAAVSGGLGLVQAIPKLPAFQVSILFAPQDAPFGHSLERYLTENGLRIQEDLQESVQAHVNARINLGSAKSQEDAALILVLSPWIKETASLRDYWQSAQAAGMPILPVLLEDTTIPLEFGHLRWVDARRDLTQAHRQILEAVRREQERLSSPLPQLTSPPAATFSPNRLRSQAPTVIPRRVQWAQWGLFLSSALKLIVLAVLFPMALWMAPPLRLSQWMLAGLLFMATYIQIFAIMLFFMRRLSYPWLMLIQGDCLLIGLVTIPFFHSDLFWPVSSLAQIILLFPIWEAVMFAWLMLVPEIRHWALGGFWIKLQNLRFSWADTLNLLAPLFIALVFLLPTFKSGLDPKLYIPPERLTPGETILIRILPGNPLQYWTFTGSQGELVTIQIDGGFNSYQLQFFLTHLDRFLIQSQITLGRAMISSFRLPQDGEFEVHLADLPRQGIFRLSLSLQQPLVQELECGIVRQENIVAGRTAGWTFQARQGDTLNLQMDALGWSLDPWMSLYSPSGVLAASDDDGGRLYNARIFPFQVNETGAYSLITAGKPGTSGDFELALFCSR